MSSGAWPLPVSARPRRIGLPPEAPRLHFVGICGKGMGAIATALASAGWIVSGSDEETYPPMDLLLRGSGVRVATPYAAANIPADTDLVVVGKRVREDNPELRAVVARGVAYCSFPALLRDAFLTRSRNAVVAGGLGKTTTTAMLAWILERAGRTPDYVIGGIPRDLPGPARLVGAGITVLEGDEYASCFDDPAPKFEKYQAEALVVTNVIDDHPDLFGDDGAIGRVFAEAVARLPPAGCLILPDIDDAADALAASSPCPVFRVGGSPRATSPLRTIALNATETHFRFEETDFRLPMAGRMNVLNAAMAAVAARHFGVPLAESSDALGLFTGVARRQERRTFGAVDLVVDKATHPRALAGLIDSVRQSFPGRRIVSLIRPRATGGRRWVYQRDLPEALAGADAVLLLAAYEHNPEPSERRPGEAFDLDLLHAEIARGGTPVRILAPTESIADVLPTILDAGDVVVLTLPEQDIGTLAEVEAGLAAFAPEPGPAR